jgi:hypothetical protein
MNKIGRGALARSMLLNTGSAAMSIPAPPPNGESSTLWCTSVVCSRKSCVRKSTRFSLRARPNKLSEQKSSTNFGNSVNTSIRIEQTFWCINFYSPVFIRHDKWRWYKETVIKFHNWVCGVIDHANTFPNCFLRYPPQRCQSVHAPTPRLGRQLVRHTHRCWLSAQQCFCRYANEVHQPTIVDFFDVAISYHVPAAHNFAPLPVRCG